MQPALSMFEPCVGELFDGDGSGVLLERRRDTRCVDGEESRLLGPTSLLDLVFNFSDPVKSVMVAARGTVRTTSLTQIYFQLWR